MITCILPMAGAGSRFTRAGYALPKYAIPAQGQPLLVHALRSLPLDRVDRLVLVAQRSAVAQADPLSLLPPDLARRVSALELIDGLTGGQAETVLAAQAHIDERPLLIYNCDTAFHSPTLADLLTDPARSRDGVLGSFAGRGSHWSFARLDPQGRVLETAEKQRISPLLAKLEAQVYHNYVDHVMDNYTLRTPPMMKMVSNPDRQTQGGRLAATRIA